MNLAIFDNWGGVTRPEVANADMDWMNRLISFSTAAANTAVSATYMHELNQINLERAAKGLPALSPAEYAPTVSVGVSGDTQKTLLMLGAGLGVVALIAALARR